MMQQHCEGLPKSLAFGNCWLWIVPEEKPKESTLDVTERIPCLLIWLWKLATPRVSLRIQWIKAKL